jgi:hypothetical protein
MAPPAAPPHRHPTGQPNKTMLLDSSEGIVSYTNMGGAAPYAHARAAAAPRPIDPSKERTGRVAKEGPALLFWIACLVAGLAVGVAAYWLVLELGN